MRVTLWQFPPGTATGWHRHDYAYVVVPLTTGALRITSAEGCTEANLTAGIAYSRPAGITHDVANPNPFEFAFVEIELKDRPLR